MTKYTIVKRADGLYQPQQDIGRKYIFPAFDSLRDAHIYMEAVRRDYKTGIVGNVTIKEESC